MWDVKRNKYVYVFITLLLTGLTQALADVRFLPDSAIDTAPEVAVVNDNFRYLNTGKLDLKPGNIIPREDSRYDIGGLGAEFANLYVDNVDVATMEVDTMTVTAKLVAGTASYGCVSFYSTSCDNEYLYSGRDVIVRDAGVARAALGGGGYAHVGSFTNHEFRLRSNNTDRVVIETDGDVGIGLTSGISSRLHVQSAVGDEAAFFSDGSNYTLGVARIPSVTGGWLYGTTGSALGFGSNNTEYMRLDTSGQLGIGVLSSLAAKLHVVNSGQSVVRVSDGSNYTMDIGYSGSGNTGRITTIGSTADLALGTDSTDRLFINQGGQVGIGGEPSLSLGAALSAFRGNSDDTLYSTIRSDAGGGDVGMVMKHRTSITVSTHTATVIINPSNYASLCVVAGDNSSNFFADLLMASYGVNPTTISSTNFLGSPPTRTYSSDGTGNTSLLLGAAGSGNYQVHAFCFDLDNR